VCPKNVGQSVPKKILEKNNFLQCAPKILVKVRTKKFWGKIIFYSVPQKCWSKPKKHFEKNNFLQCAPKILVTVRPKNFLRKIIFYSMPQKFWSQYPQNIFLQCSPKIWLQSLQISSGSPHMKFWLLYTFKLLIIVFFGKIFVLIVDLVFRYFFLGFWFEPANSVG
jgi:hypothetical protein